MKRITNFLMVLLLMLSISLIAPSKTEAARRRYLRIKYKGSYRYVRLYINGRYKGKLYRNRTKRYRARTKRTYKIVVKMAGKRRSRSVYLPSFKSKRVVFYGPNKGRVLDRDDDNRVIKRKRKRYLRIRYRGNYRYVRLYFNGVYRGRLRRNSVRSFYRRTGRYYTVRIKRYGRVRRKRVYLRRNRTVTFYGPNR